MATAVLKRKATQFYETTPKQVIAATANENPAAYHNLVLVNKLTKGKFPIYLTTSKVNKKPYILKEFPDGVKNSKEHFENEVRFSSLDHPNAINIVQYEADKTVTQNGESRKFSYIVSEYAPYGDFFDFLVNHKDHIDERLVRTYFRQLIDGIEYLHGLGIAHLDLKPENLLIGADFNLKIADFDVSHVASDDNMISRGTRCYRAPEFYEAKSANIELESPAAADIYSAGIILFVFKCGGIFAHAENRLIDGENFVEMMYKHNSKFWTKHCEMQRRQKDFFDSNFKDLFNQMVKANHKQRSSIKKIKESKWYNGPVYTPLELQLKMNAILLC